MSIYICGMSSICLGDKSPRHMDGKVKDNSANVKKKKPHIYINRKVKKFKSFHNNGRKKN